MKATEVADWLADWQPTPLDTAPDFVPEQLQVRDTIVSFLRAHPDGLSRECRVGHVTASAFVVDLYTRRAAVVHHGLAQRWLQPGGHLENFDVDVTAAARREAEEETGLCVAVDPRPLRLDVHAVRCRLPHGGVGPSVHFDIGLLAVTLPGTPTQPAADPVAWWDLNDPDFGDATMQRLRHAARARFPR